MSEHTELLARLDSYKRVERHNNMAETMHWFRQWKLLAEDEAAAIRDLQAAHTAAEMRRKELEADYDNISGQLAAAKSEADLYADKLTKAERHRINAEQNFAAANEKLARLRGLARAVADTDLAMFRKEILALRAELEKHDE